MQAQLEIIPDLQRSKWANVLQESENFDFYHLPEYHILSEMNGEGRGVLFAYHEGSAMAAWPFLLRDIAKVDGLENSGLGFRDATSVYGYPGPIWNASATLCDGFFSRFQKSLARAARGMNIVSLFSRMHPIFGTVPFENTEGILEYKGQTVSIDLSSSSQDQISQYRENHRRGIHHARRDGYRAYREDTEEHLEDFIALYTETMQRVRASQEYFFGREYFRGFLNALGSHVNLFVARKDLAICSAALFVRTGPVIQYHLGGSNQEGMDHSLIKLIIDEARIWGASVGAKWLHLGGGVGAQEDSLFLFKAGFSQSRHNFFVWKNVLMPEIYENLVQVRKEYLLNRGHTFPGSVFFPLYRANPVVLAT